MFTGTARNYTIIHRPIFRENDSVLITEAAGQSKNGLKGMRPHPNYGCADISGAFKEREG
jgi:hypothetical protein